MPGPQRILIALMKLCGVRQIEAAQELKVPRSRLASWLSGYTPMPDDAVLDLHRLINARLDRNIAPHGGCNGGDGSTAGSCGTDPTRAM